jgi:hypothetical protein
VYLLLVTAPFAAAQGSEKVLSELIIALYYLSFVNYLIVKSVYFLGSILVLTLNLV